MLRRRYINMKTSNLFNLSLVLAAFALICPESLAIEWLSAEISQSYGFILGGDIAESMNVGGNPYLFSPLPTGGGLSASKGVSSAGPGGAASATATVSASYMLGALGGSVHLSGAARASGYVLDNPQPERDYLAQAAAVSGTNQMKVRFIVYASDGDLLFNVREASHINFNPPESSAGGPVISLRHDEGFYTPGGPLVPGLYTLEIISGGASTAFSFDHPISTSYDSAVTWTFDGHFPGETSQQPILPVVTGIVESDDDNDPPPGFFPDDGADVGIAFPVQGEIGFTGSAFVGIPTQAKHGALITGYEISSEQSPFTSFVVPELLPGTEGLTVDFGSGPQEVIAGETMEFGPEGVQSFTLAGFDPQFGSADPDAFVFGLKFAQEGLASIVADPILFIPEGDFNTDGVVDGADYVVAQKIGSIGDIDTWRTHFGEPSIVGGSNLVAVPEPFGIAPLVVMLLAGAGRRRWHAQRQSRRAYAQRETARHSRRSALAAASGTRRCCAKPARFLGC